MEYSNTSMNYGVFLSIYDYACTFCILAKPTKPHMAPLITAPPTVQVNYYMDARLECNVTGFPTPSIIWSFNDVTINIQLVIITFLYCMNNIDGVIVVYNLMNISSAISWRNKIHLYEMMMRFASFNIYGASSLKQKSANIHVTSLGHIILIQDQLNLALSP
jgi:hypothetical protein